MDRTRQAFTLVELLVVITLIVILMALLVPAMDQAIYQAELTVCAAKLRATGVGTLTYAAGNKKRYPDRPSRTANGSNRPTDIYWGRNENKDDRVILRTFVDLNAAFNDPLIRSIDVEGSKWETVLVIPYALFFGWGYDKAGLGDKVMLKLGDRWTYTDPGDGSIPAAVNEFSLLASDWDGILENVDRNQSSHPDRDGILENYTIQDEVFTGVLVPRPFTLTVWRTPPSTIRRGPIDLNYAYDDGSVQRLNDVPWDAGGGNGTDSRLLRVHQADAQNTVNTKLRVPAR